MIESGVPLYAVVTERDVKNPFLSGGAILHETYIQAAKSLDVQQKRAYRLQGSTGAGYGRSLVVKAVAIDTHEIEEGLSQRRRYDGSVLYAPGIWIANDPDGPIILETRIREAEHLEDQLERIERIKAAKPYEFMGSAILRFHV